MEEVQLRSGRCKSIALGRRQIYTNVEFCALLTGCVLIVKKLVLSAVNDTSCDDIYLAVFGGKPVGNRTVRLADGPSPDEGRVEVYHK